MRVLFVSVVWVCGGASLLLLAVSTLFFASRARQLRGHAHIVRLCDTVELADAVRLARSRAATARLRAKEARSIATQKTATATALTIQAKEMLDAAATVGEDVGGGEGRVEEEADMRRAVAAQER